MSFAALERTCRWVTAPWCFDWRCFPRYQNPEVRMLDIQSAFRIDVNEKIEQLNRCQLDVWSNGYFYVRVYKYKPTHWTSWRLFGVSLILAVWVFVLALHLNWLFS